MATVIISVILILLFAVIVRNEIKKHKNGKGSCTGNCSSCNLCKKE